LKSRGLLIAAALLAVLSGLIWWSNKKQTSEVKPSAEASPKILTLTQADVTRLSIRHNGEPAVELARNDSGTWQIAAPQTLAADQDSVSSILSTLSSYHSERLLEEKVTDFAPYGLTQPSLEVAVTLKDNRSQKLLIGDQTPAGNSYYAALAGDPRLFTVAGYNKTNVDKTVNDLRDRRLLTADFDKVSQIELANQKPGKKQDITFAREKDSWQILKPKPYRAQSYPVEELVRTLKDARFDAPSGAEEAAKNAVAFASAGRLAVVKVSGASGTHEIEVRKAKDDCYAKSSAVSGVYKVPATLGSSLDKTLDDYREKKLFDFAYQEPDKIEIHDGSKAYFVTHTGSDWWGPDGKKLEEAGAQTLVGKLRDLEAGKFPDSGFGQPSIELTVTSNGGKRVERVSIAKSGDAYIAKRANEPALYEISASAVTDLQKAAADLKPAPEPKK